ncbi:MAG: NAD+ synthase [Candidatus Bathyarchaeota archaeon]
MLLSRDILKINPEKTANKITLLLRKYVESARASGVVLGMSGGVDSSVAAILSLRALGKDQVIGISIPEMETLEPEDIEDASKLAQRFKFKFSEVDISETINVISKLLPVFDPSDNVAKGNLKSRIRMLTLYYFANRLRCIVVGTTNKSELLTGYFTKYGDGSSDIAPLGNLYKTQVYQLASYLKIPKKIILKRPSAGLWRSQYDEDEFEMKYKDLDLILYGLENNFSDEEIADQLKVSKKNVKNVRRRLTLNKHKRFGPILLNK